LKLKDGKLLSDFASFNFLGLAACETIRVILCDFFFFSEVLILEQRKVAENLSRYGVGACGPPGFYGTIGTNALPTFLYFVAPLILD
jgi:7-keto-8-aminopelargonate synthetase-like enzyme